MRSPFTPGVGIDPAFLAGREDVIEGYRRRLADGSAIGKNVIVSGLRGVGKTVLLKRLASEAALAGWVPVTRELTRRSNRESELVHGLLAEVALRLKGVTISRQQTKIGLGGVSDKVIEEINLDHLMSVFEKHPGDKGDKLLRTISYVADIVTRLKKSGMVFLLDEFQVLEDDGDNFSLSLVLDAASRLQSSTSCHVHFVLAGLPTLMAKSIEAKPHVERLFPNVVTLGALDDKSTRQAIVEPLKQSQVPKRFAPDLLDLLVHETAGYPYFIQYFADVAFSTFDHSPVARKDFEEILPEVHARLDESFFAGRLQTLTSKERAVILATAKIPAPFTPTQVVEAVRSFGADVTMGAIQQYLLVFQNKNVIFKVRRGAYDYALPLFGGFLKRCLEGGEDPAQVLRELGQ